MTALSRRIPTLLRWATLSGQVAIIQILVQGINAVTGLILVRHLGKNDYAWFTIASSLLTTLNGLGDGGISTGLTAIGGQIHQEPGRFSQLLRDGLALSLNLTLVGFALATPLFLYLYREVAAPTALAIGLSLTAAVAAWSTTSTTMLIAANRLLGRVKLLQAAEVSGALARLGTIAVLFAITPLTSLWAMLATLVAAATQNRIIRRRSESLLEPSDAETSFRPELKGFIRALYANHLFYCVQGQIATWLMGLLGTPGTVADLGALGRLGVLFTGMMAPFTYLVIPSIARIQDVKLLRKRFVGALATAALLNLVIVLAAVANPAPLLWILGAKYAHLGRELPLALAAQGTFMLAGLAWVLVLTKGWVKRAWLAIVSNIVGIAIGAATCRLNTLEGMLQFTLISVLPILSLAVVTASWHLFGRQPPQQGREQSSD